MGVNARNCSYRRFVISPHSILQPEHHRLNETPTDFYVHKITLSPAVNTCPLWYPWKWQTSMQFGGNLPQRHLARAVHGQNSMRMNREEENDNYRQEPAELYHKCADKNFSVSGHDTIYTHSTLTPPGSPRSGICKLGSPKQTPQIVLQDCPDFVYSERKSSQK